MSATSRLAGRRVITKREAAARGRVSERTLDRLAEDGSGPRRVKLSARRVGFFEDEYDEWLESRAEPMKSRSATHVCSARLTGHDDDPQEEVETPYAPA